MSTETIVGIAIAAVLILGFVVAKLMHKREPREKFFKCSSCGTTARHTERTIEAWRNNNKVLLPNLPRQMARGPAASGARALLFPQHRDRVWMSRCGWRVRAVTTRLHTHVGLRLTITQTVAGAISICPQVGILLFSRKFLYLVR